MKNTMILLTLLIGAVTILGCSFGRDTGPNTNTKSKKPAFGYQFQFNGHKHKIVSFDSKNFTLTLDGTEHKSNPEEKDAVIRVQTNKTLIVLSNGGASLWFELGKSEFTIVAFPLKAKLHKLKGDVVTIGDQKTGYHKVYLEKSVGGDSPEDVGYTATARVKAKKRIYQIVQVSGEKIVVLEPLQTVILTLKEDK